MSQYDDFRDDDIADEAGEESVALYENSPYRRFNAGLSVGALAALALILMVAWNSGWIGVNPLPVSTVSQLPPTPPPLPPVATPQAQPKT